MTGTDRGEDRGGKGWRAQGGPRKGCLAVIYRQCATVSDEISRRVYGEVNGSDQGDGNWKQGLADRHVGWTTGTQAT